ncbi:MAG TPA: YbhN family protein [Actinoplanes sp.]|nr:YbhN family protein [Actinoplanes sp.]
MTKTVSVRASLLLLVAAGAVVVLRDRLPDPGETLTVLGAVDGSWVGAAVIAMLGSQVAFAGQQRVLLAGHGVRVPGGRMLAMTLSRSAMSMTLPAGSALSAAFAFRVYRRYGAETSVAVAVTAVSGVLSLVALGLLYLTGWLVSTPAAVWWAIPVTAVAAYLGRRFLVPLAAALINWSLDMFCLVAAAAAAGVTVGWWQLALVYLAVQVVRQIPITPGGVGLIEASMLTGLVTAGLTEVTAAAVVLLYRLVSFWMILPMGLLSWLATRRE